METIATTEQQENTLKAMDGSQKKSNISQDTLSKESKTFKHSSQEVKLNEYRLNKAQNNEDDRLGKKSKTSERLTDDIKSKEGKLKTTQISKDDCSSKKSKRSERLTDDIKSKDQSENKTVHVRKESPAKIIDKKVM